MSYMLISACVMCRFKYVYCVGFSLCYVQFVVTNLVASLQTFLAPPGMGRAPQKPKGSAQQEPRGRAHQPIRHAFTPSSPQRHPHSFPRGQQAWMMLSAARSMIPLPSHPTSCTPPPNWYFLWVGHLPIPPPVHPLNKYFLWGAGPHPTFCTPQNLIFVWYCFGRSPPHEKYHNTRPDLPPLTLLPLPPPAKFKTRVNYGSSDHQSD